jgi:hypothetical protein
MKAIVALLATAVLVCPAAADITSSAALPGGTPNPYQQNTLWGEPVGDGVSTIYHFDNLGTPTLISYPANDPSSVTILGPFDVNPLGITGADFDAGGTLYNVSTDFTPGHELLTVNPATGQQTSVGTGTSPRGLQDLAYDHFGGRMLAIDSDAGASELYEVNLGTGAATSVTPITGPGFILTFGVDDAGTGWVMSIADDNVYKLNLGTVATTLLGPGGRNYNFSQGGTVDQSDPDNPFYAFVINNTPSFFGDLVTFDKTSGAEQLIGHVNYDPAGFGVAEAGDLAIRIPEPASLCLLAIGAVALIRRR